jgi:hypothetical protein
MFHEASIRKDHTRITEEQTNLKKESKEEEEEYGEMNYL